MPNPDVRPAAQPIGEGQVTNALPEQSDSDVEPQSDARRHPGGRLGTSARRQEFEDAAWEVATHDLRWVPETPLQKKLQEVCKADVKAFIKDVLVGKALPTAPREMPIPAPESGGRKGDVMADNEEDLKVSLERLQRFHDAINPKVLKDDAGRAG